MLTLRRANERGHAEHGWLDSRHTFSFANFYDPEHMGYRNLRVINEDRVAPGQGFGTHSHRDMEILSYVIDGGLQHRDSMGTGSVIRPGDVQRMTAGSGVAHSEFNASDADPVHFLQIWLLPKARGLQPGYEQKTFTAGSKQGRLVLVASPEGRDGSVTLNADANLYAGIFAAGERAEQRLTMGQHGWVHVVRGSVQVNGADVAGGGCPGAIARRNRAGGRHAGGR